MSYTAPNNIQTKADAIIALASTLANEDLSARGDGTVNTALDVLADQLAGSDVDVPPTNAGAILELAQYMQGGGGGVSFDTILTLDMYNTQTGSDVPISSGAAAFDQKRIFGAARFTNFSAPNGAFVTLSGDFTAVTGYGCGYEDTDGNGHELEISDYTKTDSKVTFTVPSAPDDAALNSDGMKEVYLVLQV